MKQKVFWLDLAVCSLWLFVALANCSWWSLPTHFLMIVTVVMRIILSFTLYRGEKRSWIPLTVFSALFALLSVEGPVMRTTGDFADLPFVVMGINNDHLTHNIIKCILLAWLFLGPIAVYIVGLIRKTMKSSTLTWKDALGAILWKDKGTKAYCQLMLIAICALYAGLAMDMRMCRFACVVLPPLSLYLIARYMTSCKDTTEKNPVVGKLWMMVAAMVLFFYAQRYAGMWRVWMLAASIAMVAYVCWRTFGKLGLAGISILATVYLGILLPTLAIGYNQYACIEYGRRGLYTLEPLRGIFYIKDTNTDTVGLQDSICQILDKYCDRNAYGHRDRLEIRVTNKFKAEIPLSHVKMTRNGINSYYDYSDQPYISEDSVTLRSGEFATDSVVRYGDTFHVLHYSYDVKRDSTVLYNIDLKTARQSTPQHEELNELAKSIETLLKQ